MTSVVNDNVDEYAQYDSPSWQIPVFIITYIIATIGFVAILTIKWVVAKLDLSKRIEFPPRG